MKHAAFFSASLLLLTLLPGCTPPEPIEPEERPGADAEALEVDLLRYEVERFDRTMPGCDQIDAGTCPRVLLTYPVIEEAGSEKAAEAMNAFVRNLALMPPVPEDDKRTLAKNPEALAKNFFAEIERFREELPDAEADRWYLERTVEVVHDGPDLASLRGAEASYTGGPHPNTAITYRTFDLETGGIVGIEDVFREGTDEELRALLIEGIREVRDVPEDKTLRDAGFELEEPLPLPENFAVVEEGLVFFYNAYEIGPYATGPTEVMLHREDVADLRDPEGPLGPEPQS